MQAWEELHVPMDVIRAEAAKARAHAESKAASSKGVCQSVKLGRSARTPTPPMKKPATTKKPRTRTILRKKTAAMKMRWTAVMKRMSWEQLGEDDMWNNVVRIVGERGSGKKKEYQVEWEGDEWKGQFTWEPAEALDKTIALKEYLQNKKNALNGKKQQGSKT